MFSGKCPAAKILYLLISAVLMVFLGMPASLDAAVSADSGWSVRSQNILVLHSYGPDYSWSVSLNEGITTIFDTLHWSNTVRYEYMDTKNIIGEEYRKKLISLFRTKYGDYHFDGILATDNNALDFLRQFGHELFGDVPVVATGINGADSLPALAENFTIIPEEARHQDTLNQALKIFPASRDCYVLVDSSVTGRAIMTEVQQVEHLFAGKLTFHYVDDLSFDALKAFVGGLAPDSIVYLLPYFQDAEQQIFPQGRVAFGLAELAAAPIFVSWGFQLDTGVLGGAVVDGYKLGEAGARTLLGLLEKRKFSPVVRVEDGIITNIYDFHTVQRYGIDQGTLPENVVLLHRIPGFFEQHRQALLPAVAIIGVLVIFLLLVFFMWKKEIIINKSNQLILDLNKEVIDTQRELVATLGEVIETRSHDTGNHVQRVARISRFIGEKWGLKVSELDVLEAASPLHDVGKIGISDSILNKPGRLDSDEIEMMRKHTDIGRDILVDSDRRLLSSACSIAYEHHEHWDGKGYPKGLKGEEIHLYARITALADVYDALSSKRCYKDAWPQEKVLHYISEESGKSFDPNLASLFLEYSEQINSIRESLS